MAIIIYSTKSTYINSYYGTSNYGSSADLLIGLSGSYSMHGLIEFDLTNCPSSFSKAELKLNCYQLVSGGENNAKVERITASWNEATVTYNTKPASTGNYGTFDLSSTGVLTHDITTLVKEWKAGTYNNYGLIILGQSPDNERYSKLRSDDYETEADRPRLIITPSFGGAFLLNMV